MRPCLIIPCYDHGATLGNVLTTLEPLGVPCLVIDDGSDEENRRLIAVAAAARPWVQLERCPVNEGRGAALCRGYRLARQRKFTHALQIDADGQHDAADVPALLELSKRRPEALVLGAPVFDASAPRIRLYGRWLSRVCVWIETTSLAIRDPLCGLRCLPLEPLVQLIDRTPCGHGMEFDTEILVRLAWEGIPVESVPVHVRYFEGGVSHFDFMHDNLRITWLHTRLFLGMLRRATRCFAPRVLGQ